MFKLAENKKPMQGLTQNSKLSTDAVKPRDRKEGGNQTLELTEGNYSNW